MIHTALVSLENKNDPILIVDKKGDLGKALAEQLKNESLVVLVSRDFENLSDNVVHVPFLKKIPTIPDNTYSHIFLIDESSDITETVINPFLKKAEIDKAAFILCVNRNNVKNNIVENVLKSYDRAKVAVLGDIFSKDKIYSSKNEVNDFIHDFKKFEKIIIPGDGTREIYPVFFEDAVNSILEATFGSYEKEKIFLIFSKKAVSLLKIASIFKKIYPQVKIDYSKEAIKQAQQMFLIEGKYLISDDYNLEEKIKKIDLESSVFLEKSIYKKDKVLENKNTKSYWVFLLSFIFSVLISPIILVLILSLFGLSLLYPLKQESGLENISLIKSQAFFAANSFSYAKSTMELVNKELSFFGQNNLADKISEKIIQGENASDLLLETATSYEKTKNIINETSKDSRSDFFSAYAESKKAYYSYQKLLQQGVIPLAISNRISDSIKIYSSTVDFWAELFGFNGKKTYMVLFENNMELRPGGGFIGSYGVFNIDKGKISNFKIYDVYDADGQLKTHVEPPFAIRRYMPSVHWYLRDSNFNVDFSKGAVASAIFLSSEMHQNVDGVISVDLSFIKELLSAVGPVNVSDYKQVITADNFFQITEQHAEKDFFPGSTQKKDFLKSFYNSLILKLTDSKNIKIIPLVSALANSIYEKHIMFSFNSQNLQTAFSLNGYSSSLVDNRQEDSNIVNDFIGINESNLGANKVNYFIARSLSHAVYVGNDGSIREKAVVGFNNSADSTQGANLVYKNYLRIILPLGASISSIKIDNISQNIVTAIEDPSVYEKKNFIAPKGLEIEKYNQDKNTIYGFLVNINPKSTKTVEINYTLLQKVDVQSSQVKYDLKVFKQPGVDLLPYEFSINYPGNLTPISFPKNVKIKSGLGTSVSQVTRDEELIFNFGQK